MDFAGKFIPVAGEVGLLSMLTYFSFLATFFALAAGFVFFLAAQKRVAPEHRTGMVLTALIVGVAGVSYCLMRGFYTDALHAVADARSPAEGARIIHNAYLAIGQFRYMNWLITTPLLRLKNVLVLDVKPRNMRGRSRCCCSRICS